MNSKNAEEEKPATIEKKKYKEINNRVKSSLLNRRNKLKRKTSLFAIFPVAFFSISFLVMLLQNDQEDFSDVVVPDSARTKLKK
eukprot:gene5799-9622_t